MKKDKSVRSPFEDQVKEEALTEALRRQLGAEQMLIIYTKGEHIYHLRFGFCVHELRSLIPLLLEIVDDEAGDHKHV